MWNIPLVFQESEDQLVSCKGKSPNLMKKCKLEVSENELSMEVSCVNNDVS
jgi:hypothetical protein